jgi:S1-C subfamily serine protease
MGGSGKRRKFATRRVIPEVVATTFQILSGLTQNLNQRVRGRLRRSMAMLVPAVSLFIASAIPKMPAQTAQTVAERALQSVVMLSMDKGKTISLGSGFRVCEGVVGTNLHVVQGSIKGSARSVGTKDEYEVAGIVASDVEHDLAVLSVPGIRARWLALGDSSRVAVGDEVYVVGNPRGLEGTFSQGIVSALREVESRTLIQITAPISPGSSRGPVLNLPGEVVGVAEATVKGGQNLNFAVPASYLAPLLASMKGLRPLFADTGRIEPRVPRRLSESKIPAPGERLNAARIFSAAANSAALRNSTRPSQSVGRLFLSIGRLCT